MTDIMMVVGTVTLLAGILVFIVGEWAGRRGRSWSERVTYAGIGLAMFGIATFLVEAFFVTGTGSGGPPICDPGTGPVPDRGDC